MAKNNKTAPDSELTPEEQIAALQEQLNDEKASHQETKNISKEIISDLQNQLQRKPVEKVPVHYVTIGDKEYATTMHALEIAPGKTLTAAEVVADVALCADLISGESNFLVEVTK